LTALVLEGVSKNFGDVRAVDGVDLSIATGGFVALLGPSGCGKSTLLRLIAGLETADAGRIIIDGVDVTAMPPWSRPVNTVFQSYALFPHLDVAANIAYGLHREGLPRTTIAERVAAMIDLVKLGGLECRKPQQLSGGQRQRVALARSLAKLPKLLLLDEPMAALDRALRDETQGELAALQKRIGITFVLVTHDQTEAMGMAEKIAVMRRGRIVQFDAPRAIYERPADSEIARFVGSGSVIDGVLAARDGERAVLATSIGRFEGRAHDLHLASGDAAAIVLRPEILVLGAVADAAEALTGQVSRVVFVGARQSVELVCGANDAMRRIVVELAAAEPAPAQGAALRVTWRWQDAAIVAR
jgi:putrescine transport system ATP-binding protein